MSRVLRLLILCAAICPLPTIAATYTLTIVTNGSGIVSRNPTNSVYPSGSVVTVTATSGAGWFFVQWTGDENSTTNPLNVLMSSNKVITAVFDPLPTYLLSLSTNGSGSIILNPSGGTYPSNTVVSATASPGPGWVFVNWEGAATGTSNPAAITMDQDKSLTANFAQPASIDTPPQNVLAEVGDTVSFHIHAVGTEPLSYQWGFNGSPLNGENSTNLTLMNIQPAQEGAYFVIVSNAYGMASNAATLTITNGCVGTNVVASADEAALRAAIAAGGKVRCCFNGTITLSSNIDVTRDVTLDAHGRSVVLSGNNAVRLFTIEPGVHFSATNLVFANGRNVGQNGTNSSSGPAQAGFPAQGGAIFNNGGAVSLISCSLVSNSVTGGTGGSAPGPFIGNGAGGDGQGGAIYLNGGSLYLESATVISNSANGGSGPGSPPPAATGGNGQGGAIYNGGGTVVLLNCNIGTNLCTAPAGGTGTTASGGALFQNGGSVALTNCGFGGNVALGGDSPFGNSSLPKPSGAHGGALVLSSGSGAAAFCVFNVNTARGGNAYRASGTGEAQGGAIYSLGTFVSWNNTFAGNGAISGSGSDVNTDGRGGALYNRGAATVNGCTIVSNLVVGGSAGMFGTPTVTYPGGNGLGGGIWNQSQITLTNCTLCLNSAAGGTGGYPYGLPGSGIGGGIYNSNGVCTAVNITVASNSVAAGQGYTLTGTATGANVARTNGTLALRNSLVAYPGSTVNAWGTVTDSGFNICSDGSANFNSGSSFNFTDPLLSGLADNGGATLTMALSPDSPAIDFGTTLGAPPTDQRGLLRPSGSGVDMGAYELQVPSAPQALLSLQRNGGSLQLAFEAQPNVSYVLQQCSSLGSWADMETIGPFGVQTHVLRTVNPAASTSAFFRLSLH